MPSRLPSLLPVCVAEAGRGREGALSSATARRSHLLPSSADCRLFSLLSLQVNLQMSSLAASRSKT